MARRDIADLGRRIDEPALRRHVRDRDQLGARADRALQCLEVELPGAVVADHVDLNAHTRLHLQKGEIVRQVLGPHRDDAVARPERNRIKGHVPAARGAFHERDLVPARADQGGDGVVDIGNATLRLGRSLVAADGGLARQVAHHRVEDRTRRQRSARVVEVKNIGHTGRIRSEQRHVERHDGLLVVPR